MDKPIKSRKRLTDAERHKRFVETANKIEASEESVFFDKAFAQVTTKKFAKERAERKG